jgi:hypothetical protein
MKKEGNSYGTAGSQGTARFSLWSMEARGWQSFGQQSG